jgi:hypothetical protein
VVVLCVVLLAARLLTAAVVAATYLVLAAVAAAPVLAVAWALSSLLTGGPGAAPAAARDRCDPSYPEWCITDDRDLDCPLGDGGPPYAPASNLRVRPPDPHHLDGDHNGIGCEG